MLPVEPVVHDVHSYGNPGEARVRHVSLALDVIFSERTIQGTAVLTIEQVSPHAKHLVLDSKSLQIDETEISPDGTKYREAQFEMGQSRPYPRYPIHHRYRARYQVRTNQVLDQPEQCDRSAMAGS